jgi:hypothetical protein
MNRLSHRIGVIATALAFVPIAFIAGRASVDPSERERQCIALIDEGVILIADLTERLRSIPSCDCPGPEECDMEATCNRDAMLCCMTLARQVREAREENP